MTLWKLERSKTINSQVKSTKWCQSGHLLKVTVLQHYFRILSYVYYHEEFINLLMFVASHHTKNNLPWKRLYVENKHQLEGFDKDITKLSA